MSECLRHATYRLGELARAAGVYMDAYMAISLVELGLGGLLQRLPRLLPVVQTTVRASCLFLSCVALGLFCSFVQLIWFGLVGWVWFTFRADGRCALSFSR